MKKIDLTNWLTGYSDSKDQMPEAMIQATVPGAVQLDIAKAENYADYTLAENYKQFLWTEDKYWTYKVRFNKPEFGIDETLWFCSKGIDYQFDIYINTHHIHSQEGMFTYVNIDISKWIDVENELIIKIYPIPKSHRNFTDRTQADHSVKPAVSYGWDWHPRLVPSGIWDDTFLEIRPSAHISESNIQYTMSDNCVSAELSLTASTTASDDYLFKWQLMFDGNTVAEQSGKVAGGKISFNCTVHNPKLWWPHDMGDQNRYEYILMLLDEKGKVVDEKQKKTGFRSVRLIMNESEWNKPVCFPQTRGDAPAQLEINGRKIFALGTNWVNPDIFPGRITGETYTELLKYAKNANFNILRVWGGGIINKEIFHELCDEMGLLVWQEFPLACNNYTDDRHYLKILEDEATSILKRVGQHPSTAFWCGGNELSWSGMTDQSHALRLLNSLCFKYDRNIPFNMTSPLTGMAHGHYIFFDENTGEDVFQLMSKVKNTAYTEFGMPSPSSVETLEKIIPPGELFPLSKTAAWEAHHAYKAWTKDTWLMPELINRYFGPAESLEQFVANGQLLQSIGYQCIYEESRRQKPHCAMALNWCYNEPWPTAANNSLLEFPARPKPSYKAVKASCRPVLASAAFSKFLWVQGETLVFDLWILNNSYRDQTGDTVTAYIKYNGKKQKLLQWNFESPNHNQNIQGPAVRFALPDKHEGLIEIYIEAEINEEWNSRYYLLVEKMKIDEDFGTSTPSKIF